MRSLTKPIKKISLQKKDEAKNDPSKKKDNKKPQSKKISKTIFFDPFHYKIQILEHDANDLVQERLLQYFRQIRKEMPIKMKKLKNEQFISFKENKDQQKPALIHKNIVIGIKSCLKSLKTSTDHLKLIIIIIDQKKYDIFEQLLCAILYYKKEYLLIRDSPALTHQLGIHRLSAIGLADEDLSDSLSKHCSKCMIQIPWLLNTNWIPLAKE